MKTIDFLAQELSVFIGDDFVIFSGTRGDIVLRDGKLTLLLPGEDDFELTPRVLSTALFYIKLPPYERGFMEK